MEAFINRSLDSYISSNLSNITTYGNDHLKSAEEILLKKGLEDYMEVCETKKSDWKAAERKEFAVNSLKRGNFHFSIIYCNEV